MNLILVRKRNEIQPLETKHEEVKNAINKNDTDNNGAVDKQADNLTQDDKELEQFFQMQIKAMDHCSLLQLDKLPKVKLTKETEGSANRILGKYLTDFMSLEITDKNYVMGKAIAFNFGMKQPE